MIVTHGQRVLTNKITLEMPLCDHEEVDTRLIVHIVDALNKGQSTCLVRTVDTDVVIILVGKFFYLTRLDSAADIWVAFGVRKEKCLALPFFHSFTGWDTTSAFFRRGKRLAWEAWNCFPSVSTAFVWISLLQKFHTLFILGPS